MDETITQVMKGEWRRKYYPTAEEVVYDVIEEDKKLKERAKRLKK